MTVVHPMTMMRQPVNGTRRLLSNRGILARRIRAPPTRAILIAAVREPLPQFAKCGRDGDDAAAENSRALRMQPPAAFARAVNHRTIKGSLLLFRCDPADRIGASRDSRPRRIAGNFSRRASWTLEREFEPSSVIHRSFDSILLEFTAAAVDYVGR